MLVHFHKCEKNHFLSGFSLFHALSGILFLKNSAICKICRHSFLLLNLNLLTFMLLQRKWSVLMWKMCSNEIVLDEMYWCYTIDIMDTSIFKFLKLLLYELIKIMHILEHKKNIYWYFFSKLWRIFLKTLSLH